MAAASRTFRAPGRGRDELDRRAFTLIELLAALVLIGALSALALPSLGSMRRTQDRALAREIERRLVAARARAITTGEPAGVRIDPASGVVAAVRIAHSGGAPTAARGATGDASPELVVSSAFPGAAVSEFVNGDGAATHDTIWFDYAGVPHLRDAAGASAGEFTVDAIITISGGHTVTVRRLTGLVE